MSQANAVSRVKPMPQYRSIYESLREQILSGRYQQGMMLPFERELSEQYNAQRITVRHALDLLVESGLICKRPGVGSFVARSQPAMIDTLPHTENPIVTGRKTIYFLMSSNSNDIDRNVNAYNSALFFAMEQTCRARGLSLMFMSLLSVNELQRLIENDPPVCVLLVSHTPAELYQYLLDRAIPTMLLNAADPRSMSIIPDNMGGVTLAMDELFSLGHRRIGFIGGTASYLNAKERKLAYQVAFWTRGLAANAGWMIDADWTSDGGEHAMKQLLALPESGRLTAVMCASDMMAFGASRAIQAAGYRIGEDISVVGFDNVPMCRVALPSLTTVGIDTGQMTQVAFRHILAAINGEDLLPHVVRITTWLVRRSSCAACQSDEALSDPADQTKEV